MDPGTVATLIAFACYAVALFTYLVRMKRDLLGDLSAGFDRMNERFDQIDRRFDQIGDVGGQDTSRFDRLERQLEAQIGDLRQETRAGFAAVDTRLAVLEQRTDDMAAQHPDAS